MASIDVPRGTRVDGIAVGSGYNILTCLQAGLMQNREESVASGKAWISWLLAIAGWLICAGFCLAVTVGLEIYAYAYDVVFPAVMIMLFGNILVFMFISSRFGNYPRKMFSSIIRVCAGEGIILAGLYLIGRYCIGY